MKTKMNRLRPLFICGTFSLILIGCIYAFTKNAILTFGTFVLIGFVYYFFIKALCENYFLKNENEAIVTAWKMELDEQEEKHEFVSSHMNMETNNKIYHSVKDIDTRLSDVAGLCEAKEEVMEIIDFLKNPKKYTKAGAKLPRGILFEGPPGTGKTLLAKAVAGEAGVNFIATSGSDFVEKFVGVGAQRIRELFQEASKEPTLIFIDEIDAIGGKRGNGNNSDSERERTLNQLLVEMDGFNENKNIVVIAATNRKEMLDKALLRPGRFERHIKILLPTLEERKEILSVHSKNKHLSKDVSIESLARKTNSFSGAELASLLNEAALMSVRNNRKSINMRDCEEALDRVILGPARKSMKYIEKERQLVAYHEAGHAVIGLKLSSAQKVERITIVPRGESGGYNLFSEKNETFFATKNMIIEKITGLLGGRAAEQILFNDISSGASNDLMKATSLAHSFVCDYGMSQLGMICYSQIDGLSDNMKEKIDKEMNNIIDECYQNAIKILEENRTLLDSIAQRLLEKETIDAKEVEELMVGA